MLRRHRLKLSLAVAAAFVLAGPISVAVADDGAPPTVPDDVAAAAQYRESVPTASGKVASANVQSRARTLTPSVQAAIGSRGGRDKKLLRTVGSSSAGRVAVKGPQKQQPVHADRNQPSAAGAALGTLGLSPETIALLVVLIGGTVLTAVVARRRPQG
jgi:hypothetical protein